MALAAGTVLVHLEDQAKPISYSGVENTYTKGGMFCLKVGAEVHKHPLARIFRVTEPYRLEN